MLFSSCTTLPSRETTIAAETDPDLAGAPEESRFVKLSATVSGSGESYPVWRTCSAGKPVLLLHPINGLSPALLHLALEMEKWGYRVYLPSLYGDPIMDEPAYGFDKGLSMVKFLKKDGRWNPVATDTVGPIVDDVAGLARWVSSREGGRRIAVVGNSLTGMVPLAVLDESVVRVAVLGQPATPVLRMHEIAGRIPQPKEKREALSISEDDWDSIERSLRRDSRKRIFGFHYVDDPVASIERFDVLNQKLSDAGLASRFKAYVMERPGQGYADDRSSWVVGNETSERRKMLTPHSTYGAAESAEDQEWFRKQLKRALGSVSF
ncbi:MAG: alpha/beta fold hydrolase [Verrucomicrobiota bacterium]